MKKEVGAAGRAWEIVYPIGMYYVAMTIGTFVAQMIFGATNESYMLSKIIGSLVAVPVVYMDYKSDLSRMGVFGKKISVDKELVVHVLFAVAITICISISLNNIISMSPLMAVSDEYEKASNAFYGGNIGLELVGAAIVTPILEELLYRGVVYGRLRRRMQMWPAIVMSALVFGAFHFNVVQFTYATLVGIIFAIFVEKTGFLYPAILGHVVANAIAVVRTETGILADTVDGSVSAWLISVGLFLIGVGLLIIYAGRKKR